VAADLFYEHGYEAASLRHIAKAARLQVGSLYNHINGKEDLLVEIMVGIMNDLLAAQRKELEGVEDVRERLQIFIRTHIRFHAERARDVFIGNSELRALSRPKRKKVVALRDEYQGMLSELIKELAAVKGSNVLDAKMQTFAVLALGGHVASWYSPDGPMSLDEIAEINTRIALRQLGIDDS
jgi:AcrR family transcriptional regulator